MPFLIFLFASFLSTMSFAKPNPALYNAIMRFENNSCGAGSCYVELKEVLCQWTNESTPKNARCTYKNDIGETKQVTGNRAADLVTEINRSSEGLLDCGMGKCGFRNPQNIKCGGPNEEDSLNIDCSITDHEFKFVPKEEHRKKNKGSGKSLR